MRLLALSAALALLAACDSNGPDPLVGTWTLARVEAASGAVPFAASTVTFGADGDFALSSCDTCSGTYRAEGDGVQIVAFCTEACADNPATPAVEDLELSGLYGVAFRADSLVLSEPADLGGRAYVFAPGA